MAVASRAIIIENNKLLVMQRDKHGSQYFTLVGGRANDGEPPEQAVAREVHEETGLRIVTARLVYIEKHDAPYAEQYIFICQAAPHQAVAIQDFSEESYMNRLGANTHTPLWAELKSFSELPFRTPQLQKAIVEGLKQGFPAQPVVLS